MKRIGLFLLLLIAWLSISSVAAFSAVNPEPYFCKSQGYNAVTSFFIEYKGKKVQLISEEFPANTNKEPIFMIYFRNSAMTSYPYNKIVEILGLSEAERGEFVNDIKNGISFEHYAVSKVTATGYEGYLIEGPFEVFKYCDFPGGQTCGWKDFRDGKCGKQYKKEIPCVGRGGLVMPSFQKCCGALEPSVEGRNDGLVCK